jgi:hypothetical protein
MMLVWPTHLGLEREELRELVGEGDRFVARIGFQLRGAASGVEVEVDEAWAIWMREGRFFCIEQYGDWAEALAAAGPS